MKLLKLQLKNFRNYADFEHNFDKNKPLTIIHGENGHGKTNLLEAIYVLSIGKSFKSIVHEDLLKWDMDFLRVVGEVEKDDEINTFEVFYTNYPSKKKNFKNNGVSVKQSNYIGNCLTVLFQPEDLNILYLSPELRRKYANILLSQVEKAYLKALFDYQKTLKQRNALLEEIRKARFTGLPKIEMKRLLDDLNAWDEKIIESGSLIIERRIFLVKFLNKNLEKIYQSISGEKEDIFVEYKTAVIPAKGGISSNENIQESYAKILESQREKDILQAKTTIGPHRDDLIFYINNKEINLSASRGEFRTLLLAIKLAEIDFIKSVTKETPILLLDDVFSELDKNRQNKLLKVISDCQTIITTTDLENLGDLGQESAASALVEM